MLPQPRPSAPPAHSCVCSGTQPGTCRGRCAHCCRTSEQNLQPEKTQTCNINHTTNPTFYLEKAGFFSIRLNKFQLFCKEQKKSCNFGKLNVWIFFFLCKVPSDVICCKLELRNWIEKKQVRQEGSLPLLESWMLSSAQLIVFTVSAGEKTQKQKKTLDQTLLLSLVADLWPAGTLHSKGTYLQMNLQGVLLSWYWFLILKVC